jgi:hypothetical protein
MIHDLKDFRATEVVREAFLLTRRNMPQLYGFGLLCFGPGLLLLAYYFWLNIRMAFPAFRSSASEVAAVDGGNFALIFFAVIIFGIGALVYQAALHHWIRERYRNQEEHPLWDYRREIKGMFWRLVGVNLITSFLTNLVDRVLSAFIDNFSTSVPVVPLGLFSIAATFYLSAALMFAVPSVILEFSGPLEAVKRSWNKTRGRRGRIIGALLLAVLLIIGIFLVLYGFGVLLAFLLPVIAGGTGQGVFVRGLIPFGIFAFLAGPILIPLYIIPQVLLFLGAQYAETGPRQYRDKRTLGGSQQRNRA